MKLLIIAGGNTKKLDPFIESAQNLEIDLTIANFNSLNYNTTQMPLSLYINNTPLTDFDLIYIRMVGKRIEDATLLANFAKDNNLRVIDQLYMHELLLPSSISKALEMKKLSESDCNFPPTFFASLKTIGQKAPEIFGYPYVIKSTEGKKGRDVWAPKNQAEFDETYQELIQRERAGTRFFAQQFLRASQRIRSFIIGDQVVGAITQPTKYRKRFLNKTESGDFPEAQRGSIELSEDLKSLSLKAARAAGLEISGIDILIEDNTNNVYIIEANAAPSWNLINKHCQINVEEEILKYLVKQLPRHSGKLRHSGLDPESSSRS